MPGGTERSRTIPSPRYALAKSIFLSALVRPRPERNAWVAEECRGDDRLRREVEQLLVHHDKLVVEGAAPGDPVSGEALPGVLGEFRILGLLGRGGMGVVYRARRGDGPPVALKVLRPGLLTPDLLARFGREAEVLSRLAHPDIARLLDSGLLETPAGPQPYLAMALFEGTDLRRWSAAPRPLEERLELLARVCEAVHHAHGLGIVHRDLKPENILVRSDGSPCVLDFGVARLTESDFRATTLLTSTGVLVGTLRYMSPEQADARPGDVDARSDVYSLGVIAYELLSGEMPYDVPADSIHRALVAVLTAPPRRLAGFTGRRGRALEAVLGKALAKLPANRYAGAADLAADLRRLAAGRRPLARNRRHGPALPPLLPLIVLGMAAAFAAGAWLGGLRGFRAGPASLRLAESVERRVVAQLDSAATQIYFSPAQAGPLAHSIVLCDGARALLGRTAHRPSTAALERAAWVLAMEAHLRLAEITLEPREYEACIVAGEQADRIEGPEGQPVMVPAGAGSLFEHLADARYEDPRGVMALAASRLGIFSRPLTHQWRALAWSSRALAAIDRQAPPHNPDADSPDPMLRDLARRTLLGERSVLLARTAYFADSAALARDALAALAASREGEANALDARAEARLQLRSGFAWAMRARLEGDAAAFDSAGARLRAAVAAGFAARSINYVNESRLYLAELGRWRARTRAGRDAARADLEAALVPMGDGLAQPADLLIPRYRALLTIRRAQVQLDLAAIAGEAGLARAALAALASADSLFPATTYPVPCSEIGLERARGSAVLWALGGDGALRDTALRGLEAARALVPADDDPGRARRIAAGVRALERGRRAKPDLWFPIPSGPLTAQQADAIARGRRPIPPRP